MPRCDKSLMGAIGVVIGVFALWIAWGLIIVKWVVQYWGDDPLAIAKLGQVGDIFGGVNALFAALAFAGVAFAAYFQRETWKLQAAQSELARKEHVLQSFEPLFFKLLDRVSLPERLQVQAIVPVDAMYSDGTASPQQALNAIRTHLRGTMDYSSVMKGVATLDHGKVTTIYAAIYSKNEPVLGPYFRALYHVFRLVYTSGLDAQEQVKYANIARSTLSSDEVFLLALNGLSAEGNHFGMLCEYFGLLKHYARSQQIDELVVTHLYDLPAHQGSRDRVEYWATHPDKLQRLVEYLNALMSPASAKAR